jgi:hypothetical protein
MAEISYRRHRFPPVIIQHAVWLYECCLRFKCVAGNSEGSHHRAAMVASGFGYQRLRTL